MIFSGMGPLETLILTKVSDYLTPLKKIGFYLTKGRKIPRVPKDPDVRWRRDLVKSGAPRAPEAPSDTHDPAVILYSGGTTGKPKGVLLSNLRNCRL